uniref:Exocyst complex component 3 n=1 Tax=Acrobeloides nanus TaxID=290746 RepID=A0A914BVA9_9BILA
MLKTGVQSQLEWIRITISHLHTASDDIKEIEESIQEAFDQLKTIPQLKTKMSKLNEATIRSLTHSPYAAALENLLHIFNITATVEKTQEFIVEGNLLHAHRNIMELERARDDLMFEVYKLPFERREYDKNLLKNYFIEVERLVLDLGKQVWYICLRALDAVRENDDGAQQLASASRIIEREERPRRWKAQLFEVLLNSVRRRVEGNQFEDRTINKQWLARYLEVCRRTVVEDLKIVKRSLAAYFPPEYKIYDRYIQMYHDSISQRLREIAAEFLEKNELVQLLSWIQAYGGESMLGSPILGISTAALLNDNPLLPHSTTIQLYVRFIEINKRDIREWLDKALMQEKDVTLAKEISLELTPRVIEVAIDEFLEFSSCYKDAAMAFKVKHFEDRSYFMKYTATMIAIANNLDICVQSTDKLEKHIPLTIEGDVADFSHSLLSLSLNPDLSLSSVGGFSVNRQKLIKKIDQLKKKWHYCMQFVISSLLDEVYEDISKHLEKLMSKEWLIGSYDLETICITIADYHNDYRHLRPHIRIALLKDLLYKVVGEFLIAIDNRRLTFSKYEERHLAAERIRQDARRISQLFESFIDNSKYQLPNLPAILLAIADIIDLRDKSILPLEASSFVRKYSDIHVELLTSILQSREDLGKAESKWIAEELINRARFRPRGDQEMLKLFQMCKLGKTGRTLPALVELFKNMFQTLVLSATKSIPSSN